MGRVGGRRHRRQRHLLLPRRQHVLWRSQGFGARPRGHPLRDGGHERNPESGDKAGLTERRSEEHTSELQSLMRISYAVFCLKKKNTQQSTSKITNITEKP